MKKRLVIAISALLGAAINVSASATDGEEVTCASPSQCSVDDSDNECVQAAVNECDTCEQQRYEWCDYCVNWVSDWYIACMASAQSDYDREVCDQGRSDYEQNCIDWRNCFEIRNQQIEMCEPTS